MRRNILLVVLCLPLLGTTCLGEPALPCANPLDGSEFGFTLSIPDAFQCQAGLPAALLPDFVLALVSYADSATSQTVSVVVSQRSSGGGEQADTGELPATMEQLDNYTTANNIEFILGRATPDDTSNTRVSYAASVELSEGGNLLLIVLEAAADDPSLQGILTGILDTVQLTG